MRFIKRILRKSFLAGLSFIALVTVGFFLYAAITLIWTGDKDDLKDHDAIIVLTGSQGRIEKGFELLLDKKAPQLLISGVLKPYALSEIVNARKMPQVEKTKIKRHCCIDLDYVATTTAENAIESAKWIQKKNVKSIILVTSAAHMPRARLQFDRALDGTVQITSFPVRVKRRLSLVMSVDFWLYAAREYSKYIGSWFRLEQAQK